MTSAERALVEEFKEFLRIRSVSLEGPTSGAYRDAVNFLTKICARIGLKTQEAEPVPNKPILIATWEGSQGNELPTVLLNSHYDVVPAQPEKWSHPPFDAFEDGDGNIFARGTQDMKCVCLMYLHAIEKLKTKGWVPTRTIHLTFVPDEEVGGVDGLLAFSKTAQFHELRIGVALDEGLANPKHNTATVFYGERAVMWGKVTALGNTGHASRFIPDTAVEKLMSFLSQVYQFRKEEQEKLGGHGCAHATAKKLGDVVTMTVTMVECGVGVTKPNGEKQYSLNVVPPKCVAGFDMRIPPSVTIEDMRRRLDEWTACEGMSWEAIVPPAGHFVSSTSSVWWGLLESTLKSLEIEIEPEIFPAATDSRFLRELKIPAFGFSPITDTPILLHDHDEFINAKIYLRGIDVYSHLIPAFASNADASA